MANETETVTEETTTKRESEKVTEKPEAEPKKDDTATEGEAE
jgi:hypothetical protein